MNVRHATSVHFIGIGGINMSACAKLLLHAGIKVSGSDRAENDQTRILAEKGASVTIGESAANIPEDCNLVIVTSAAAAENAERIAASERRIPEITNFAFLGQWFADATTVVVAGTHGKSTTTAMLGLALEAAGMEPSVIVGSVVPGFRDGNLRIGREDLFIVEGDEYAHHFLEFRPFGLVLTNIELDHPDVFASIDVLLDAFHELVGQMKDGGVLVANVSDDRIRRLRDTETDRLKTKKITLSEFTDEDVEQEAFTLSVPGRFNRMNAAAALAMARALGADPEKAKAAIESFGGIWRRFEFLGVHDGARVYSDYGHHPTAVTATLEAARESFPSARIVLCFQPHHRNRTKILFNDFVASFDGADVLVLSEIYAVEGRDEDADRDVTSRDLMTAVHARDYKANRDRIVKFENRPSDAIRAAFDVAREGDVVIVMGAGDIDATLRKAMSV